MSNIGPTVIDRPRVKGDPAPVETFTYAGDLTGHTATLVVAAIDGGDDVEIEGDVTYDAGTGLSTMAFDPHDDLASVDTAGTFDYSVITDKTSTTLRRTVIVGDWIVVDYAG
jgi:hypothetical protein